MFSDATSSPSRVRDLEGNVPLAVVVWFEHHPTAMLAAALASSATGVRWLFRLTGSLDLVLRGSRIEILDSTSGARVGSARLHGVRSAADFDTLPRAAEPPPFSPPDVAYPALHGFACDLDGRVARFQPPDGAGQVGPGLIPRLTSYANPTRTMDAMVGALSVGHTRTAYPVAAFAARVPELVRVLTKLGGAARVYSWFEDDRVVVWPLGTADLIATTVSQLHARAVCLGCSRHDPRDALGRGTFSYSRSARSGLEAFVRDDLPDEPLDVASTAALLGRSPAELAATQLNVRFETAARVDLTKMRRAM